MTAKGLDLTYRFFRDNGRLIGANELWIAATDLAYGKPVVTRNEQHYRRVPGLSGGELPSV